jgi:hypothetical protein
MLLAERGYDADRIRALAAESGAWANLPPSAIAIALPPKAPPSKYEDASTQTERVSSYSGGRFFFS